MIYLCIFLWLFSGYCLKHELDNIYDDIVFDKEFKRDAINIIVILLGPIGWPIRM